MITLDEAKEFIKGYGVQIPDLVLQAMVDMVNAIEPCLQGYTPPYTQGHIMLIQLYALAALALTTGSRVVTSESAPSGAGRSFKAHDDALKLVKSTLAGLDKSGCTDEIIASAGGGGFLSFNVSRA